MMPTTQKAAKSSMLLLLTWIALTAGNAGCSTERSPAPDVRIEPVSGYGVNISGVNVRKSLDGLAVNGLVARTAGYFDSPDIYLEVTLLDAAHQTLWHGPANFSPNPILFGRPACPRSCFTLTIPMPPPPGATLKIAVAVNTGRLAG